MFRGCPPTTRPSVSCISLHKGISLTDYILLINFSPGDKELLKSCIMQNYLPGVAGVWQKKIGVEDNIVKFDLVGSPWSSHGGGLHARSLLVHLFAAAVNLGFQIVASADVNSKSAIDGPGILEYPLDVDSIYPVKIPTQGKLEQSLLSSYQKAMM